MISQADLNFFLLKLGANCVPVVVISPILVSPGPAAAKGVIGAAVRVVGGAEVAAGEADHQGDQGDGGRHPCSAFEAACCGHTDQNG